MSSAAPTGNTYDKYATKHPIERRLVANFLANLERLLPSRSPARILEVGIGEGEVAARVAELFPAASFVGIDLYDVELAQRWSSAEFAGCFADVAALPFPDRSFDLVLGIEVLEHVTRPDAAVQELARVASRDVLLSVPREPIWRVANMARGKYLRAFGNTPGHLQHWGRRGFVELAERHFEVQSVCSPFPWTLVSCELPARPH